MEQENYTEQLNKLTSELVWDDLMDFKKSIEDALESGKQMFIMTEDDKVITERAKNKAIKKLQEMENFKRDYHANN